MCLARISLPGQEANRQATGSENKALPRNLLPEAGLLAGGTFVSRIMGFFRDMLVAYALGPGADAFLVAFRVPNVFRRLLAEGSLGMAYGAAVARIFACEGRERAVRFGQAVIMRVLLIALPCMAFLALTAPALVKLLAPGLGQEELARAALLLRLCLPYLPLSLVCAIAFTHAAAFGSFRPQAWGPVLFNVPMLLAAGIAAWAGVFLSPKDMPGETLPELLSYLLCFGVVAGGLAQAAWGGRYFFSQGKERGKIFTGAFRLAKDSDANSFLRRLPAAVFGAAPHQLHVLAGTALASLSASGSISALYFAERLIEIPLGMTGAAVGMAVLPELARQAAQSGERSTVLREFSRTVSASLRLSAFFSLPAAAGLMALALPLCSILFGHGAYHAEAVASTASTLAGYAAGLPALCAARPLLSACHALDLAKESARASLLSLCLMIPASLAGLAQGGDNRIQASLGLGAGLAVGAWTYAWLLLRELRRKAVPCPLCPILAVLVLYFLAAFCLAAALFFLPARNELSLPGALAAVPCSAIVWLGLFFLGKNRDARALFDFLRGRG